MYLRFSSPPKDLWGWVEYYLADETPFKATARGTEMCVYHPLALLYNYIAN